jgi:hypothetical protein
MHAGAWASRLVFLEKSLVSRDTVGEVAYLSEYYISI